MIAVSEKRQKAKVHMDTGNLVVQNKIGISPSKKEGEAAIRYELTSNGKPKASFRGFKTAYDAKAENKTKWLHFNLEAYGDVVEKMKKMGLKEKSFINVIGHLDQSTYKDEKGMSHMFEKIVIDHIEYAQMAKAAGTDKTETVSAKPAVTPAPEKPKTVAAPTAPVESKTETEQETLDAPGYAGTIYMDDDEEMPFNL